MGYLIKFVFLPVGAALVFLNDLMGSISLPQWVSTATNVGALAVIFAGFTILARYRALLDAEERNSATWRSEHDAKNVAVERLSENLRELQQQYDDQRLTLSKLQALPDMSIVVAMLEAHDDKVDMYVDKLCVLIENVQEHLDGRGHERTKRTGADGAGRNKQTG